MPNTMPRWLLAVLLCSAGSCSSAETPRDHGGAGDAGKVLDASDGQDTSRDGGPDEVPRDAASEPSDAGRDARVDEPTSQLSCDEPFSHQGVNGCLTSVEGVSMKFFPLEEGTRATNLAVYLHQDTAWEWYSNDAFPAIVTWARARDILVIAPLAPEDEDGEPAYGSVGEVGPVETLGRVIETVRDAYGASRDRIYYWGGSGGAWLMAFWFIPQLGERLPGIFVASCGGDVSNPYDGWTWDPAVDMDTRARIGLYFNYGSEDFLAPYIEDGLAEYREKGFEVDSLVHQGDPHCVHPIDEPTIEFWSRHL